MKIAIILPTIITKNGTAKQSLELAKVLKTKRHQITFCTFSYSKIHSFPEFATFPIRYCVDADASIFSRITKSVSQLESIFLYVALLRINKFRSILPITYDVFNPHDWFGMWVASGMNKTIVVNINDVPQRVPGNVVDSIKLYFDKKYARSVNHFIILDKQNSKKLTNWIPVREDAISVIRSGIDTEKYTVFKKKFDYRKAYNLSKESIILVCANLLTTNRRFEDIIDALHTLGKKGKQYHLFILTKRDFNPSYASLLDKVTRTYSLQKQIHFIDKYFTDEERMMYIQNADMLVFPNSPQTWGLTVIEAMALGVPVVVSKGSGVSEVLVHNSNAFLYEAANVKELSAVLVHAFSHRPKLRQIAEAGRKLVLKSFSWEKFALQMENVMQKKPGGLKGQ